MTLSLRIGPSAWKYAFLLVGAAAAILGLCFVLIGPNTAQAGYLSIMMLLSASRAPSARYRVLAALWAVAIAMLGYLIGPLGLGVTLAVLALVAVAQGLFKVGEIAFMTRSPVNFMAFATVSHTEVALWQVLLGALIGAGFIVALTSLLPAKTDGTWLHVSVRSRVWYGLMVATGATLIVVLAELTGFAHVSWALLSFCMILAVGADQRTSRAIHRLVGSLVGVFIATLAAFLPGPGPLIAALIALLLCVAYLREGNYALFVTFLTPAVLLTTASDASAFALGAYRLEAVLVATVVAVLCSALFSRRLTSEPARKRP